MPVQYLLVTFPEERAVLADGKRVGFTNHTMLLERDEYEITLEGEGYQPPSQDIPLAGTSLTQPMVIGFEPIAALASRAARGPTRSKPAVARTSAGRTPTKTLTRTASSGGEAAKPVRSTRTGTTPRPAKAGKKSAAAKSPKAPTSAKAAKTERTPKAATKTATPAKSVRKAKKHA